ncbi:hypothetical protein [Nitrosococcus watsonii]|uniref:Uncharacterized protein n=1 Tax=Nitrosococcus watsoni (strain C-113) TaxID=105559 RepID=D8K9V6_NITWC|nr:hypothetical protein [Nitrosococcus watsonii]ADJ29314.1 hypothetical protein Nwat_2524 [Nitrosococcus watsonii C-113]
MTRTRLEAALWEADRHLVVLEQAMASWAVYGEVASLNEVEGDPHRLRVADQVLFRFMKLQDALGMRLVPATLAALGEPFEEWPMRDRLDRLEKLHVLNATDWFAWREIRNRLAHEYPDRPQRRLANLLAAVEAAGALAGLYRHWRTFLQARGMA